MVLAAAAGMVLAGVGAVTAVTQVPTLTTVRLPGLPVPPPAPPPPGSLPPAPPGSLPPALPPAPDAPPEIVLESYLQALANGDSERALSLCRTVPGSSEINDRLLDASVAAAPLTSIQVSRVAVNGRNRLLVPATFRLGGRQVRESYALVQLRGSWQVDDGWIEVDLGEPPAADGVVTVNGLRVPAGRVALFPGRYTVESAHWAYRYTSGNVIEFANGARADEYQPRLAATKRGADAYRRAVRQELTKRVAQRRLVLNGNCPFRWATGGKDPRRITSVRWRISGGSPFKATRVNTLPMTVYGSLDKTLGLISADSVRVTTDIRCSGPYYLGQPSRLVWTADWPLTPCVRIEDQLVYGWSTRLCGS